MAVLYFPKKNLLQDRSCGTCTPSFSGHDCVTLSWRRVSSRCSWGQAGTVESQRTDTTRNKLGGKRYENTCTHGCILTACMIQLGWLTNETIYSGISSNRNNNMFEWICGVLFCIEIHIAHNKFFTFEKKRLFENFRIILNENKWILNLLKQINWCFQFYFEFRKTGRMGSFGLLGWYNDCFWWLGGIVLVFGGGGALFCSKGLLKRQTLRHTHGKRHTHISKL